jgi:hypothetical protein
VRCSVDIEQAVQVDLLTGHLEAHVTHMVGESVRPQIELEQPQVLRVVFP